MDYPTEVQQLINNGLAVPMAVEARGVYACPNCYGIETLFYWEYGQSDHHTKYLDLSAWPEADRPNWYQGAGWYHGSLKSTPCPACQGNRLSSWLAQKCRLEGDDLYISVQDYEPLPGKEAARDAALALLGLNYRPTGFVTFYGSYGTGKTHLLKGIVNGFRLLNRLSVYSNLSDLLADIRSNFGEDFNAAEGAIEYYRDVQVLAIDELDKINPTPWARNTVHRLLDARYNQREERLTVIAMNTAPELLSPDFGYLVSRMRGGQVIEVAGADMRPALSIIEGTR